MPRLSTYLGRRAGFTFWYLSAAPELLALAAGRPEADPEDGHELDARRCSRSSPTDGQALQASPHTVASYRDTFLLLLASCRPHRQPPSLRLEDLDAEIIAAFLDHLEADRPTASAPATPAWPRCAPCSVTLLSATPSTPT